MNEQRGQPDQSRTDSAARIPQLVRDETAAKQAARAGTPLLYASREFGLSAEDSAPAIIGRRYTGIFGSADGSFVSITPGSDGELVIDRDPYASIPIFYSTRRPAVSTDVGMLVGVEGPGFNGQALAEYLSAAYLAGGQTIFEHVRFLMPNEVLHLTKSVVRARPKRLFPAPDPADAGEVGRRLEVAIDNSIADLLQHHRGTLVLNLSGGVDSTLLLAKIREREPDRRIITTTYFHEDWRQDLNDWEYAEQAARRFGTDHRLLRIVNAEFCRAHHALMERTGNVFHTYAAAFYAHNAAAISESEPDVPLINGSGPDESIIGTEKIPVPDLLALRSIRGEDWIERLIRDIDYLKIPEAIATQYLRNPSGGFLEGRKMLAAGLMEAPDFVEFQRRYHAVTVLQDHVQELTKVAQALARPIIFPYLTSDIFRIVFATGFDVLNQGAVYKSVLKRILEKYMPHEFVHRTKIGFQSPSRPYFKAATGLGGELSRLLQAGQSELLDLGLVAPTIRTRLEAELDLRRRYDFLEWTAYNILLLEELRRQRTTDA